MPVVVGSGPNGLAAAIVLAQAGREVTVLEAEDVLGGGCRSAELTLPGYVHDLCATVHALALASPFLRELPLPELVQPEAPLAHPLDDGTAVMVSRSVAATAAALGADGQAYRRLMAPLGAPRAVRVGARPAARAAASGADGAVRAARGAVGGRRRALGLRRASGRGRCLRAAPRTRCCR